MKKIPRILFIASIALLAFCATAFAATEEVEAFMEMSGKVLSFVRWTCFILSCAAFMVSGVRMAWSGDPNAWKIFLTSAFGIFLTATAVPFVNFVIGNLGIKF